MVLLRTETKAVKSITTDLTAPKFLATRYRPTRHRATCRQQDRLGHPGAEAEGEGAGAGPDGPAEGLGAGGADELMLRPSTSHRVSIPVSVLAGLAGYQHTETAVD